MAGFRGLPNQILEITGPSALSHESGSIFIPLSINGSSATYFFDTGAWSPRSAKGCMKKMRNTPGLMSMRNRQPIEEFVDHSIQGWIPDRQVG